MNSNNKFKFFHYISILFLISSTIDHADSYKLNVPKVLLPFYSSKQISFILEAKSETNDINEDLCFTWSSSRPDIVSIVPYYENGGSERQKSKHKGGFGHSSSECSHMAIVSAVSKHPQRLTSIILAKEAKTDKIIRCDVIVDKIESIRIKHTTTHLYLEDSPESFMVEALDAAGNTFSSLDGLPFEWSIINDPNDKLFNQKSANTDNSSSLDSRNVLRINKFIESEYELTESIRQLEKMGLTGNKILIEGLKTGIANVQSKLIDPYYKDSLITPLVRLLVVANILLEPSYPIYLLVGGVVKYDVFLIKQTSVDKIILPSAQYYFDSRNTSVANLLKSDPTISSIVGIEIGSTEIVLIDRNMKEELYKDKINAAFLEQKLAVTLPTALVHVVLSDYLVFSIKNWRSSWVLQVGRVYEIMITPFTDRGQQIFASDNLKIDSEFENKFFKVNYLSKNGSYCILTVLQKGTTQARAFLKGTISFDDSKLQPFKKVARGEQDIELLDPISLTPKILIFAYSNFYHSSQSSTVTTAYEYQITATGGSGSYHWQSRNTTIFSVNSHGLIKSTASKVGKSKLVVTDARNIDIESSSLVYVLEPIDLQLQACPVETQSGTKLYLNIQMNAFLLNDDEDEHHGGIEQNKNDEELNSNKIVSITDCSRLQFEVSIKDESTFKFVSIQSTSSIQNLPNKKHSIRDACAIVVLEALKVGRTAIKITTLKSSSTNPTSSQVLLKSNELTISSYSQLKSFKSQLVLARDSISLIHLYDGPLLTMQVSSTSENDQLNQMDLAYTSLSSYQSQVVISDTSLVEVTPVDVQKNNEFQRNNRYSYIVKCLANKKNEDDLINVRFSISHKKSTTNKCPTQFDYQIKVRCAMPHTLSLNQLLVTNENDENSQEIDTNKDHSSIGILKWKCPIKQSSSLLKAHLERNLYVQLVVRDSLGNTFDNFTSHQTEWIVENKELLDKSIDLPRIRSLEIGIASPEALSVIIPAFNDHELLNTNRLFYQTFETKHKFGSTKLTAKLILPSKGENANFLSSSIKIDIVSTVTIQPNELTIFNHPSNLVTFELKNGSGNYNAEIESLSKSNQKFSLKINQINENSVTVSPLANTGLSSLNIFDYCVPPDSLPLSSFKHEQPDKRTVFSWPPSTRAKIQVAGIDSILVNYEDDKLQVNTKLKVYVQISDATGSLIKTKYFSLMGLNVKLSNTINANNNNETSLNGKNKASSNELLATIEVSTTALEDENEYTAVYILDAIKPGVVCVQFEARSIDVEDNIRNVEPATKGKIIKSPIKDIQIYKPLSVVPKYIELIVGAIYQIRTTEGPNSPDAVIKYELSPIISNMVEKENYININSEGLIEALSVGKIKVIVKSVGLSCRPLTQEQRELSSSSFGCNKVERIYSEDFLVVKVVELTSINIQAPIKSIKRGNEMPIYLMANDFSLNPLSFASCPHLQYTWKVSDQQIVTLHHSLLLTSNKNENLDDSMLSPNEPLENAFSVRLIARQSGKAKISVRVEFRNNGNKKLIFSDSIDVIVFEEAYFTHLQPLPMVNYKLKTNIQNDVLLMSPGTSFQIKTNLDSLATKKDYEIKFYSNLVDGSFDGKKAIESLSKICNNNTIIVSKDGLLQVESLDQHQLKYFKQCTASLLVTILQSNDEQLKNQQQTLVFTVKVKPIIYAMIKLKSSLTKVSSSSLDEISLNNIKIDKKSLTRTKLALNSDDGEIYMKWHVKYHDNLGDVFDVISTSNKYSLNRHDLVDFYNFNQNLFSLADENDENKIPKPIGSLISNSIENSFGMKTTKSGRFVMELSPLFSSSLQQSKDYLGLTIESKEGQVDDLNIKDLNNDEINGNFKLKVTIGDLICLSSKPSKFATDDELDLLSETESTLTNWLWLSQSSSIVKLASSNIETDLNFGVCINNGRTFLIKRSNSMQNQITSKLIDIDVTNVEKVKFLSRSSSFVSNNNPNLQESSQQMTFIQFQMVSSSPSINNLHNQNCSQNFEQYLVSTKSKDLIPFRCSASLNSQTGKKLFHLDRLINTQIVYKKGFWSCEVSFIENSYFLLYDLIANNMDRSDDTSAKKNEYEPTSVLIRVDKKLSDDYYLNEDDNDDSVHLKEIFQNNNFVSLPFVPAFYVETKLLKIFVARSAVKQASSHHYNLIIHATPQLHSHLDVTSNCPTLIKIKQVVSNQKLNNNAPSLFALTYDVTTAETFDLGTFASLMHQESGNLYVQISCSLNNQIEKIAINFLFDTTNMNNVYSINTESKKTCSGFARLVCWFYELTPNQIISSLAFLIVTLLTILFMMKYKSPSQQTAEQIALNASAAAAAVVAANAYSSPQRSLNGSIINTSSFNPYNYFNSDPTEGIDSRYCSPMRRSPNTSRDSQHSSSSRDQRLRGVPTSDNIRLFSSNTSVNYSDVNNTLY